jgi:hypothetical protein
MRQPKRLSDFMAAIGSVLKGTQPAFSKAGFKKFFTAQDKV